MERRSPFIWNKCWDCAIGADIGLGKNRFAIDWRKAKDEVKKDERTQKLGNCNSVTLN